MNKGDRVEYVGDRLSLTHWGVDSKAVELLFQDPTGVVEYIGNHGVMIKFTNGGLHHVCKDDVVLTQSP